MDLVEGEEVVEVPAGFIKEEDHAKRIGVQHKKYREEERARVAAEERAVAAEKRAEELEAKSVDLTIPPVPDPYSDTFQDEVQARDEAIRVKAEHDAKVKRQAEQKSNEEAARLATADKALQERVAGFDANMVKHGLNPLELKQASDTVISYGLSETFEDILLEDPDGPLFVAYLAKNPLEIDELKALSPLQLVNHLNGDIRAKASLLKPQTSNAPDPPLTPSGGGVPELKEKWEEGGKYE